MAYKQLKLWFDRDLAMMLGEKLSPLVPDFPTHKFAEQIDQQVNPLELKDRVELIARSLQEVLPGDYPTQVALLIQILGPENPKETGMFLDYYWVMPIAKYVEIFGLDHFDLSMHAISEITKRNTGEYCIRPFIEKYPQRTMTVMEKWSQDQNFHVRRLASEGGRPRLPWAKKLSIFVEDPRPLFPILGHLKDDPVKYVQKSVANCINDVLKDNPETGKDFIESWLPAKTKERNWIIKHALRNLKKKQDPWALNLLDSFNS